MLFLYFFVTFSLFFSVDSMAAERDRGVPASAPIGIPTVRSASQVLGGHSQSSLFVSPTLMGAAPLGQQRGGAPSFQTYYDDEQQSVPYAVGEGEDFDSDEDDDIADDQVAQWQRSPHSFTQQHRPRRERSTSSISLGSHGSSAAMEEGIGALRQQLFLKSEREEKKSELIQLISVEVGEEAARALKLNLEEERSPFQMLIKIEALIQAAVEGTGTLFVRDDLNQREFLLNKTSSILAEVDSIQADVTIGQCILSYFVKKQLMYFFELFKNVTKISETNSAMKREDWGPVEKKYTQVIAVFLQLIDEKAFKDRFTYNESHQKIVLDYVSLNGRYLVEKYKNRGTAAYLETFGARSSNTKAMFDDMRRRMADGFIPFFRVATDAQKLTQIFDQYSQAFDQTLQGVKDNRGAAIGKAAGAVTGALSYMWGGSSAPETSTASSSSGSSTSTSAPKSGWGWW